MSSGVFPTFTDVVKPLFFQRPRKSCVPNLADKEHLAGQQQNRELDMIRTKKSQQFSCYFQKTRVDDDYYILLLDLLEFYHE